MADKPSVLDEVIAMLPQQSGNRPWHEKAPPEKQELLQTILEGWRSGAFGSRRRTACRAISAVLAKHGISIGEQGVEIWLKRHAT